MKNYTLPIDNGTTDGMQLVRYEDRQIPQKAPVQPDELGGGVFRNCQQPQDVTGQQEDPETGEMVDVYATTPDKYQKWSEAGPVAMTSPERSQRDVYDAEQLGIEEATAQAAKADVLKLAENALIGLLMRAGILPPRSTSTAGLTRPQVQEACLRAGLADTGAEIGNLLSRIDATLKVIDDNGGWPEDAIIHEDID